MGLTRRLDASQHHAAVGTWRAVLIAGCAMAFLSARPARADLATDTAPGKWYARLAPERDAEPNYPDYDQADPIAKAKVQLDAGQYRRALAVLQRAAEQKPPVKTEPDEIPLLEAKSLAAIGFDNQALGVLGQADRANPAVELAEAQILGTDERYPQALALLAKVIAAEPTNAVAHYELGWFHEQSGDVPGAVAAYQWFVDPPQRFIDQWQGNSDQFVDPNQVVAIGRALSRWATLTQAFESNPQLHDVILSMFTRTYDRINRDDEPAHVAAAEYFYDRDDQASAQDELKAAFAVNPNDVQALLLSGRMALDEFDFGGADQAIAAIRRVDADSVDADLLEARNLLLQRVPKRVLAPLQSVLDRQPNNIEAIGLLAGAQALLLHEDQTQALLKKADAIQPASPIAYFEVAEQLSAMRQYPRSAAMYETAVHRAPWWGKARNGWGLLMTQSGDEDKARIILEAAHAIDGFNVRTTNYLKLLDQMDQFAKKESAHFIVMYDPKLDPVVPEYFTDYLETIYKDVTSDFHYEPKVKTLIEVFPSHDEFSVRTTGAPWLATVGASTGRVIALVAPRENYGAEGPFNWARVVRHEFTHTVTLGATDNRIAHWFTEGLAVWEEHAPLQWEWVPMLQDAVTHDKLFPLETLTWAFVRPKEASDRQLAYAESFWICTYIEQRFGHQAILDLLEQFRLGRDQDDAFATVLKEPTDQFFAEFCQWTRDQVAGWGYDPASNATYNVLLAQADGLIQQQNYDQAATVWAQIAKLRPMDLLPHQRLMGLYLQLEDWDDACTQLEAISQVELKDNKYVKVLARLYAKNGKLDLAHARALKAVYINPYDLAAHELLEDIDQRVGDSDGLAREERVIPILQQWLEDVKNSDDADSPPAN